MDNKERRKIEFFRGFENWLSDKKELERLEREDRMLERASPQEYTAYFIGINTKRVVTELRIIKVILFMILALLALITNSILPEGWWHKGLW